MLNQAEKKINERKRKAVFFQLEYSNLNYQHSAETRGAINDSNIKTKCKTRRN